MKWFIRFCLLFITVMLPLSVVMPRLSMYTSPYYTEKVFKDFERVFNASQYRVKDNPAIIPDETLFSYVAGAYLRGMDPIMANSEHTPLGKYFLALSILLFRNDRTIILFFALLTGISIWFVSKQILSDGTIAIIPVLLIASDVLFRNQLVTVPLLDIIQLPFIYLSLAVFLIERHKRTFFGTAICVGCVMATKTIVPGVLLIASMYIFLILKNERRQVLRFTLWLPVSVLLFAATYIQTFLNGYSIGDFIGFQKWIFLYQKSKLIYPFSSLRLLLFNQWQTWWGTFSVVPANDWSILWPISTVSAFLVSVWIGMKKHWENEALAPLLLLTLWVISYHAVIGLGVVSSRFFIPLLPAQYTILVYGLAAIFRKKKFFKYLGLVLIGGITLFVCTKEVKAEHILPYPSFMPGNKLYWITRVFDKVKRPFYFGNISSYKYHLSLADKYLIEAKTLFEYKQYLLAVDALARSDVEFVNVPVYIKRAKAEHKDMRNFEIQYQEAAVVHQQVLERLLAELPDQFLWTPEKKSPTNLPLRDLIYKSISLRMP